ncbi:Origin recognition complex subunit 5 [Nakaseomyces bracarensis]|uniref:Origin recognition complex subunit 5 n=1 Tax=Nakaseomyces bracarensis TaxID=273131 RepID=A0ABR4NQD8_9SACH
MVEDTSIPVLFRDYQWNTLGSFINGDPDLTPPNLMIQGYSGTGKTYTIRKFMESNTDVAYAWLQPIEVVSWKPLFQAIARSTQQALMEKFPNLQKTQYDPMAVEEPSFSVRYLTNLFSHYDSLPERVPLYIIYDGFDRLQDIDSQLLYKVLKLHELLPRHSKIVLKSVFIVRDISFVQRYSTNSLPLIIFPRYSIDEITELLILSRTQELINSNFMVLQLKTMEGLVVDVDLLEKLAINFIQLIVQSFQSYTGNDIFALNDLIDFKWPQYVKNINSTNIFDPLALYRATVKVFVSTSDGLLENEEILENEDISEVNQTYELSKISKYLLIAAYFCSYIEAKYDISIFSRRTTKAATTKRKKKEQNPRFLQPSFFHIERLLAIFQSIYPIESDIPKGSLASLKSDELMRSNVEVFQNLSELFSLKLIACTTAKNLDMLGHKIKWRVNVPWEIILEIADSVNFNIADFFSDIHE